MLQYSFTTTILQYKFWNKKHGIIVFLFIEYNDNMVAYNQNAKRGLHLRFI